MMISPSLKQSPVTMLTISEVRAGQRIDNFLHTYFKGIPKSHVYRLLRTGQVRINKGRIKPSYRLTVGDVLRLPPVYEKPLNPKACRCHHKKVLTNAILYEDAFLLIINKPAGLPVHGGSGIHGGVIENLRLLYPNAPYLELVHRLDRDTSGCLMIAKKSSMLRRLHELLRKGDIHKQYFALVQGHWSSRLCRLELPLKKNINQSGERIVRVSNEGKSAITQFSIEQYLSTMTLLRIQPLTGRTHQIRVHTAHKGHPIAGDNKYGDETFNQQMRHHSLKRLFLHASKLEFDLPEINYHMTVHAPLPEALQQVLNRVNKR
ncbi:23S rRNA pseudouridine(955/2504/2580) synthase RluC [Candidatus Parabeggiatoa sp. HSG14]|uniref:23S rRNA pseudouridine(955/2504/2580) synthase RluC n=1 Tax=Candidatus Parabeggiatoa sp. HSG14 TaxID=3055593 RepID=UPI0025A727AB|nr:23S rRNA pseudouridine(955/2504/2580) synthase RluC [Thiotrichales bacterium HSG14]